MDQNRHKLVRRLLLVFGVLALVLDPSQARACSCLPPPDPCEAFWEASAVFVGRVTRIFSDGSSMETVVLDVEESFRGGLGARAQITTETSDAACGYPFRVGERYLVYAGGEPKGRLSTYLCTRTQPLSSASRDLDYARNRPKRKQATIEGYVYLRDADGMHRMPGVRVTVNPKANAPTAETDDGGRFHLDVMPGAYTLEASSPGLRMMDERQPPMPLLDGSACSLRNAVLVINGRIRGQVRTPSGAAIPGVGVDAVATSDRANYLNWAAVTDSNGSYEINGLGPGSYYVGTAIHHGPNVTNPFPVTYYPGAATLTSAGKVTIGVSEAREHVDFVVPGKLPVHRLSGSVVWPDGTAAKADVSLLDGGDAVTDSRGQFSLSVLSGPKTLYVWARRGSHRYSADMKLDVNGTVSGLQLKLKESK